MNEYSMSKLYKKHKKHNTHERNRLHWNYTIKQRPLNGRPGLCMWLFNQIKSYLIQATWPIAHSRTHTQTHTHTQPNTEQTQKTDMNI